MATKFLSKEEEIITKMKESGWELGDGDPKEACEMFITSLTPIVDYVNVVAKQTMESPTIRHRFEEQALRDYVMANDRERKMTHDCCIGGMNQVNRLCKRYNIAPMFDVDTNDRYAVADMAGLYVNEIYNNGIGNMDKAVEHLKTKNEQSYDPKEIDKDVDRIKNRVAATEQHFQSMWGNNTSDEYDTELGR